MDAPSYTWYSVVLTRLPKQVNQGTIKPQVQVVDDNGVPQVRSDKTPLAVYIEDIDMPKIMNFLVYRWATKQSDMDLFRKDKGVLYFTNALKNVLNNNPSCLSWHDGDKDLNCQFNGYHMHIMVGITTKGPLTDKYDYKRLKYAGNEIDVEMHTQKLIWPDKFLNYMAKKPRIIAGTNSPYLKSLFNHNEDIYTPANKKQRLTKPSKQSTDIANLKMLMNKYQTSDKYGLFKAANNHGNLTDEELLRSMIRNPNWKKTYEVAVEELDIDNRLNNKTYYQQYMQFSTSIPGRRLLTYEDTKKCFIDWCEEQTIDPIRFIISAYLTLTMALPKRNTLYLCGKSNAGKTYITNALLPHNHMIGTHITSKEFQFQECVSKPIIVITELTIATQQQAEIYKQVFAGETILVNVKNRTAEVMHRKPVILTTNSPIWNKLPNETEALRNRCFTFNYLIPSNVIKTYAEKGEAGHHYFQQMFRLLDAHVSSMNLKPENMLKENTMRMLRPILTASETDSDPIDIMASESDFTGVDETLDLIVISSSESDKSAYEADTEIAEMYVRSPSLLTAVPLAQAPQQQVTETVQDQPQNPAPNRICGLCPTCTQSIRDLIRCSAKHDVSNQTDTNVITGPYSPVAWVYQTPERQRINNPYTPVVPIEKRSPRKRLFLPYTPDTNPFLSVGHC